MLVAGYGSSPDMTTMDMLQTSYGGYASLNYGYDLPQDGYGQASIRTLTIAMGRLLLAMDILQLLMTDMLLSAMDMTLLHMDINRPQLERSMTDMLLPTSWNCRFQLKQQHHKPDMNTNIRTLLLKGGKLLEAWT